MILTEDVIVKKGKKETVTPGTRSAATRFFNELTPKQALLNSTVFIQTAAGEASGVILGVDKAGATAYVLTARHCLYTLAGDKGPEKAPSAYTLNGYAGGIKIKYGPNDLLKAPGGGPAPVSAINFADLDATTWEYDIVLLESTHAGFITFVRNNRYIKLQADVDLYRDTLLQPVSQELPLLKRNAYKFIQLGYGANIDGDWRGRLNLTPYGSDLTGKVQCKQSTPTATNVVPGGVFSVDVAKRASDWLTFTNTLVLEAGNTTSTGPGDSGGPLFAISTTRPADFYLVGVTSGANFFSDKKYKTRPQDAPTDLNYQNNIVTYWDQLFESLTWSNFF